MSRLEAHFRTSSRQETAALADFIGCLVQDLAGTCDTFQKDPETGLDVMLVGIDGEPGAGKSVISSRLVLKNTGGQHTGYDGHKIIFEASERWSEPEREVLTWESYWSHDSGQQNRTLDCEIAGPYKGDTRGLPPVIVPPRILPGIEVLEHAYRLDPEIFKVSISLTVNKDKTRDIEVIARTDNNNEEIAWNRFVSDTQAFVLKNI